MFTIIRSIEQYAIALIIQQLLAEVFVERQEGVGGIVQQELEPSVKLMLEEVYLAEFFCIGWLINWLIDRLSCFWLLLFHRYLLL